MKPSKNTSQVRTEPPGIDMSDLTEAWPAMPPSARRQAMRARLLGNDRNLFARIAKLLGFSARRPLPTPRRVAARAMVLAALSARAYLEIHRSEIAEPERSCDEPLPWLKALGIADELEAHERQFLRTKFGKADQALVANASWRAEGLAVLSWALNRHPLPAYDENCDTFTAQGSVGFGGWDIARELLASAVLRPSPEIERYATHTTLVNWRLRQFRLAPGPWDFMSYLRRHSAFHEDWLDGLRFIDDDLAIGNQSIVSAPADRVQYCERIAIERETAVYWIQGDDRVYSKIDPSTLLSAC
jgi:hypothetical protein